MYEQWRDFWDKHCVLVKIWSRRSTVMGYVTVCWAVLELNPDIVGEWVTAPKRGTVLLVIGVINAALAHYDQSLLSQQDRKMGEDSPK